MDTYLDEWHVYDDGGDERKVCCAERQQQLVEVPVCPGVPQHGDCQDVAEHAERAHGRHAHAVNLLV